MLQTILNAVIPVAITALIGVLVAIIKALGDAGIQFIQEKAKTFYLQESVSSAGFRNPTSSLYFRAIPGSPIHPRCLHLPLRLRLHLSALLQALVVARPTFSSTWLL